MKILKQLFGPVIIFVIILVVGWFGRQYVIEQDLEKLDIRTKVTAEQAGLRLQEFVSTRLMRLDIFRKGMENKVFAESEFRSKALLLQHELSGFQAINWIDNQGIIQWVTPLSTNLPASGIDLLEHGAESAVKGFKEAQLYRIDAATPALDLIQGGVGFATYLPIIIDDNVSGYVNGVFRLDELISQCLGATIRDFNYEVILSGKRVYRRGEPGNFSSPRALGRYNFSLMGRPWELQLVPGSSAADTTDFMNNLTIVIVFIVALLVAIITQFRLQSRRELSEAYKTVEDSELKFRTIFDKSPACLLRFNQAGIITDWNREAAALFGFEFPPKLRRNVFDLDNMIPLIPAIEKALNGEPSDYAGFIEVQTKMMEVDATIEALLSGTDQIQGGIVLLNDVTVQKQASRAKEVMYEIANLTNSIKELPQLFGEIHNSLASVLDTRNFYVALYDEETGEFSYPHYDDEFDSAPPKPIKGEKGLSAYALSKAASILLSKEEIYDLNREGKIDLIGTPAEQWLGSPLIVEDKHIGVMAVQSYSKDIVFDETDMGMMNFVSDQIAVAIKINLEDAKLRKSEAMHRELSTKLTDSNDIKALLLDIITHDLKNPASVISGVADLLSENDVVSDEIALIRDSSDALLKVIDNTTSLARVTLGEEISMEVIDLSQLAQKVVQEFQPGFDVQKKILKANIAEKLTYHANPVISEVFRNYLSNALKYAPEGETVTFNLIDNGTEIELTVSDIGRSIPRESRENIFQRNVQLGGSGTTGRGLGLAIVKRIADVHGGIVGVYPNEPQGNVFYMKLLKSIHQDIEISDTE